LDAGVDPLHVTWLRVAGAALILLPLALRHRAALRTRPALLLAYGVFPMAGVQAFYFAAISRIPVGVALLIEFLGPVLVLAWIRVVRRQHIARSAAWGVLLAIIGLAFLVEVWAGIRLDPLGLALALGAAACQAGYFLLSDAASDDVAPMAVISYGALIASAPLPPRPAPAPRRPGRQPPLCPASRRRLRRRRPAAPHLLRRPQRHRPAHPAARPQEPALAHPGRPRRARRSTHARAAAHRVAGPG